MIYDVTQFFTKYISLGEVTDIAFCRLDLCGGLVLTPSYRPYELPNCFYPESVRILTALVPYSIILDILVICVFNPFSFLLNSELQ